MFNYEKLDFEDRVSEYLKKIKELGRNIQKGEQYIFSDGFLMYIWYSKEVSKIIEERNNNIIPNEERKKELLLFSKIENLLYNYKQNIYERKAKEYFEQIKKLGRNIERDEFYPFFDGASMYAWYVNEAQNFINDKNSNKKVSENRLGKIMLYAKIENYLYDIKNKKKTDTYEKKVNQYIYLISKIGRNTNRKDDFVFSDGTKMYAWFIHENSKLLKERKEEIKINDDRMNEIMLFSKIYDQLYIIKKNKKIIETKKSYNQRKPIIDDKESLKYKLKCIESIQNNRKQDN